MNKNTFKRVATVVCFFVAFTLLLTTFLGTKMNVQADLSQYSSAYSLPTYMPLYYWIALEILSVLFALSFISSMKTTTKFTNIVMVLSAFSILVVLFGTPFLVESNPRLADSWDHGKTALSIQQTGRLTPATLQYQSYPGAFLILSMVSLETGMNFDFLLQYQPLFLITVFFVMFLVFANNLLKQFNIAILAVIIYGLTAYNLSFIFSPEIFGWMFLFLLLAVLVKQVRDKNQASKITIVNYSFLILLLVAIMLVHPVTQVALVLVLGSLFFVGTLVRKTRFVPVILFLSAIVIFISWTSYNGQIYFNSILVSFNDAFNMVSRSFSSSMVTGVSQQAYPVAISSLLLFRRATYLVIGLFSAVGLFFYFRKDRPHSTFLIGILLAGLVIAPLTIFGILPIERPLRLLWLAVAPLSAIALYKFKKIGAVLIVIFLLTTPLIFNSLYWSEASDQTHDWEKDGAIFVSNNYNGSVLSNFKDTMLLKYYGNFSKIYNNFWLVGKAPDVFNLTFIQQQKVQVVYFGQFMAEEQTYQGRNISVDSFQQNRGFDCIYDNGHSIAVINATWRQFG